jgi:hypothetical protein
MSIRSACDASFASVSPSGIAPYASPHGPVRIAKSRHPLGPGRTRLRDDLARIAARDRELGSGRDRRDDPREEQLIDRLGRHVAAF